EAYAHRDVPFERLVTELKPERDLRYNPLFQVMLVLQNGANVPVKAGGATFQAFSVDTGISKYDLTLNLEEGAEGLQGWFEYSNALFDHSTIERISAAFRTLMKAVVEASAKPISDLMPHAEVLTRGPALADPPGGTTTLAEHEFGRLTESRPGAQSA